MAASFVSAFCSVASSLSRWSSRWCSITIGCRPSAAYSASMLPGKRQRTLSNLAASIAGTIMTHTRPQPRAILDVSSPLNGGKSKWQWVSIKQCVTPDPRYRVSHRWPAARSTSSIATASLAHNGRRQNDAFMPMKRRLLHASIFPTVAGEVTPAQPPVFVIHTQRRRGDCPAPCSTAAA